MMPSVLIDQNIISYGDIMDCVKDKDVLGFIRKKPVGEEGSWLREEFNCLPTVSKLAHDNKIKLHRYSELDFENWKNSGSGSHKLGALFSTEDMDLVRPAIERSYFFSSELSDYITRESVLEFCRWLNKEQAEKAILNFCESNGIPEKRIGVPREISWYQNLCNKLQKEEQFIDAFHLWTGEKNNIDYFLTCDRKFVYAINKNYGRCLPILPSQLLKILNISTLEPFEFKQNTFYNIDGRAMWGLI